MARYIRELSVTGLTSNPTIFEHAIGTGDSYDASIRALADAGLSGEDLFFELALEDLTQAADLFRSAFDASHGVDGWVSLEVSPLLADNAAHTIQAANQLHAKAGKANLFIKIPGTTQGLEAIERRLDAGAHAQRLLCASTGTKDPAAPDTYYVQALAAPGTINTLPEKTLLAFADHGQLERPLPPNGGDAETLIEAFRREGVNDGALAARLQREGVDAFATSWHALLARIREKCASPAERASRA